MKKIYLSVVFSLCLVQIVFSQDWSKKSNGFPGEGRSSAVSFVIDNCAYVGLGYCYKNWNNVYYTDFWKYDSKTDKWSQIADFIGEPTSSAVSFSINGKGYVGLGSKNGIFSQNFYEYDPKTDTWTQIADYPGGERHSSVAFVIDNVAYVGTGMTTDVEDGYYIATNEFWKYENNIWSQIASIPDDLDDYYTQDRYKATAFSLNGFGYVAGGANGGYYISSPSNICKYDPTTDSWTEDYSSTTSLATNIIWSYAIENNAFIYTSDAIYEYDVINRTLEYIENNIFGNESVADMTFFTINGCAYLTLIETGSIFNRDYDTNLWFNNSGASDIKTARMNPITLSYSNNQLQVIIPDEEGFCKIYNMNGALSMERELFAGNNLIDISNLTTGVYIINIETENNRYIKKIIK